jgi:hypothetical protein
MTDLILHVVFSDSAGGLLRQALRKIGRNERVLTFSDNLGFGPINPPDPRDRLEWMQRQLGVSLEDWNWLPAKTDQFWSTSLTTTQPILVWMSKRTVREYSAFLEWIWRLDQRTYEVVDLSDVQTEWRWADGTVKTGQAISLDLLNPDLVQIHTFMDYARPISAASRTYYQQMWKQLRAENAPLRIIRGDRLHSAQLTVFDDTLLSCAASRWLKTARIVGEASSRTWDKDGIQTSDLVLGARVVALVEAGRLEGRGNLQDWRWSEVRLPAS